MKKMDTFLPAARQHLRREPMTVFLSRTRRDDPFFPKNHESLLPKTHRRHPPLLHRRPRQHHRGGAAGGAPKEIGDLEMKCLDRTINRSGGREFWYALGRWLK